MNPQILYEGNVLDYYVLIKSFDKILLKIILSYYLNNLLEKFQ